MANATQYQWVPLDTRGAGFRSAASAINSDGQVVGFATMTTDPSAPVHAVLWDNGTMQDLGTLGGTSSEATAINDSGKVAGWATTAAGATDAFLWDNGTMQDLGPVDLRQINVGQYPILWSPVHVNEQGAVVGNRPGSTPLGDGAFLWENGATQELPLQFATALNDQGQVVGGVPSGGTFDTHAALWGSGTLTDLGTLGGPNSWAIGIITSGSVLGTSLTEARPCGSRDMMVTDPFRWTNSVMEDLGSVLACFQGEPWQGEYMNEQGQVVAGDHISCITGVWDGGAWQTISGCTWANGMSAPGAVIGGRGTMGSSSPAHTVPFVWQGGVLQDLATGSNLNGLATGINRGRVCRLR